MYLFFTMLSILPIKLLVDKKNISTSRALKVTINSITATALSTHWRRWLGTTSDETWVYFVSISPQERLTKKTFILDGKVADVGKKNWVSQVSLLLEDLNLTVIVVNAGQGRRNRGAVAPSSHYWWGLAPPPPSLYLYKYWICTSTRHFSMWHILFVFSQSLSLEKKARPKAIFSLSPLY